MAAMKRVPPIVLGGLIALYLALGVYTELKFMELKPPPQGLHEDFGYYANALADTAAGKGPYAEQSIGRGFLYPPTALFVVEPFAGIASRTARIVVFTVVSVAMACLAVWLVARSFGLSPAETWWWYALALGSAPFLEVLHMGQINTFTALGTALLFAGTSMAPWVSGVGLALGTLTKVTPVVLVLYLVVARRYEALSAGAWIIAVALGLAGLRYGWGSLAQYPGVFSWLTTQFSLDANSQSLVAKLAAYLPWVEVHPAPAQTALTIYAGAVLAVSAALAWRSKEAVPLFVVSGLAMVLSPNIVWYHHWVFLSVPLMVWMGWKKLSPPVVLWCMVGLIVVQADRWLLTHGLLIHVFGHASILWVMGEQARAWDLQHRARSPGGPCVHSGHTVTNLQERVGCRCPGRLALARRQAEASILG